MLRKIRICIAAIFFLLLTFLFLDFTGTLHHWFGWIAKIQFVPAILAINVSIIISLIIITLLLGRVYCSVICPLGIFQDLFSGIASRIKKHRFRYDKNRPIIRIVCLFVFIILLITFPPIARLLEPYSAYGRIASNLFAPIYAEINNLLAYFAERAESYAFYSVDVWIKSLSSLVIAAVTFIVIAALAVWKGRLWCNSVCPVGTILGFLSKYAYLKPVVDTEKCNHCGLCSRNCKASCINQEDQTIDYSRCVTCMNCLSICKKNAISYKHIKRNAAPVSDEQPNHSKRNFLAITALFTTSSLLKAQAKKVDGGLAVIEDKKIPKRELAPCPPGAGSYNNFYHRCTACQLCVSACPNHVLRPSNKLTSLMQPEMSYERGYCRPECTRCSEVCPTGAIERITPIAKSSIQIGHAVWIKENCIAYAGEHNCNNCARHCPVGAIQLIPVNENEKRKYVSVNTELCIGCGACENLCPVRPLSAIYIEGHEKQRML